MANNEIKTNAEIYREQRKERLAKAANKKSGKGSKVAGIIFKVICIVLVAAVVLLGAGKMLTNVFCVPQKILSAATYEDDKLTVAEYNYYYMKLFNNAVSISEQYNSQYEGYGDNNYFNTKVNPAEQDYPLDNAPEGVKTWADFFKHSASEQGLYMRALYAAATSKEAKEKGFELTKEQKEEMKTDIDEVMKQLTENAERDDFALNNYISKVCGEGLTEKSYRELLERDTIVSYYSEWYQENAKESISDKEVNAYYKDNRADVDIATIRFFLVSYAEATEESTDPTYTKKEAKARADAFAAEITDEASFVEKAKEYAPASMKASYESDSATLGAGYTKANLESLSEEFAKWVFDTKRVTGDISVFNLETQSSYCVAYIVTPAAKDTQSASSSVRHILVQAETTDEEGNALSDSEVNKNFANAKKEADQILAEWKKGKATEATFAALATEKTDDTASAESGGLYEDINSESSYVPEFLEWALDSHKVGDTGIIKTTYGYHIMYFVGASDMPKWESDIREAIATEDYNKHFDDLFNTISEKVERKDVIIDFFAERMEEIVARYTTNSTTTY